MTPQERAFVLEGLASSHSRLVALTSGLTAAQWHFREAPDRWSIAENIEHLILFERFILNTITSYLEHAAEPEKKELVAPKQALVLGLANARHIKFNAREIVRPTAHRLDPSELLTELRLARESTLAFASETQADLCGHFFSHVAWGDLDCYQWLLLLGQHSLRHALQIQQVMAHPVYPAAS
jgi:hypothetical protein